MYPNTVSHINRRHCIDWDDINKTSFIERVKQHWAAFHLLLVNARHKDHFSPSLLMHIGMTIDDFIQAFLSPTNVIKRATFDNLFLNDDITRSILAFFTPADLDLFRQISRHFYHVVEQDDLLRISHRRHLISTYSIFQQIFGEQVYADTHFLLTYPQSSFDREFRLTSMKAPYQTLTFDSWLSQHYKPINGYVFKDSDNTITVITACQWPLHGNQFQLKQYKILSLDKNTTGEDITKMSDENTTDDDTVESSDENITPTFIDVTIEDHRSNILDGPPNATNPQKHKRKTEINVHDKTVTVDVSYVKHVYTEFGIFTAYDPEEKYRAQLSLSDFESEQEVRIVSIPLKK